MSARSSVACTSPVKAPKKVGHLDLSDGVYMWGTVNAVLEYEFTVCNGEITAFSSHDILIPSLLFALISGETSTTPGEGKYFLCRR
jgi:hypothetical protein